MALKHVDPSEGGSAAPSDGRSALMDAIRGGAQLKHVCHSVCSFIESFKTFQNFKPAT